ncbi:MAG: hypothetical protein IKU25_09145 [Clostridia bacterium]|nr:hypothetical protein [Clostridia bacterium]
MFSNRDERRKMLKSTIINCILLIVAVTVLAGFIAINSSTDSNDEMIVYDDSGVSQTIISSMMGSGSSNTWSQISINENLFLLNQLVIEDAALKEELLKESDKQIEQKLNILKMDVFNEIDFSTYQETLNKMSTTTSKPIIKDETIITSGTMSGTPEQIAAWEYLLSKSNQVNEDVRLFINSVDGFRKPYPLTDYQRAIIEKAVMAESGTEPYIGVVAIAQCLRESAEYEGLDPVTILKEYQWTSARVTPNAKVKRAVAAVFDQGIRVTDTRIMFFYAPHLTSNTGHERIFEFTFQISKVRFFTLKQFGVEY